MKQLLLVFLMSMGLWVSAQTDPEQSLAIQFYQNQEYVKAAELFEKLYSRNSNATNYRYLFNTYLQMKEYDKAEKLVKKAQKKAPQDLGYMVDLGNLYRQKGDASGAEEQFNKAIKALPPDDAAISTLSQAFLQIGEAELAIKTYQKARQLFKNDYLFSYELAELYGNTGNKKESVSNYLNYFDFATGEEQSVRNKLQDLIQDEGYYTELQTQLLSRIQKYPEVDAYPELLQWMFLQKGDYRSALIQAKALDKRRKGNGLGVLALARTAMENKAYDAAIEAYQYIVDRGKTSSLYLPSMQELLKARKEKITQNFSWTQGEIDTLLQQYDQFLAEFGPMNGMTAALDKAQLLAYYVHDYDSAIALVQQLVALPQANRSFKAQCKLELGDYYLLKGEDWEASLLYSQVDKDLKDEPLGEMARFKNAKLSYYQGEFEWSQAQLDILKASTSELIANDALDLSVFIMDNMGLDTALYPMQMFAKADLLIYQNKLDQAWTTLDTIENIFPDHALHDDILFAKAKIALKKQQFAEAEKYLTSITTKFKSDILGDNATFMLGELYEHELNDKAKAMDMYKNIILDYKDSVFVIEARKRFRILRGDDIQ
ncbi:MAG: tetratricopeptide repeat protein [Chitinophagales bacterium]|nr:tetratricopeptide repeat protein [Chitinophagales bacterium]